MLACVFMYVCILLVHLKCYVFVSCVYACVSVHTVPLALISLPCMWYCAYAVSTVSPILCAQELSFGELSRIEGLSGSFLTLLEKQRTVLSLSVEHLEYLM